MAKITVMGSGAWGTTLSLIAENNGHEVALWTPFKNEVNYLCENRQNKLLPDVFIPDSITITDDIMCAKNADLIIMAVPSFAVEETALKLKDIVSKNPLIANAGKGFCERTGRRLSQVINDAIIDARVVAISGPSHAEEVSRFVPTSIVSSSSDILAAEAVQDYLMTDYLRIYVNPDIIGVELGGALKNIIALCAGISDGMGVGDNTKAALITRGLSEIARLGIVLGAKAETFAGLSGLGDLIVTCASMHSRNRRAGILIGQGVNAKEAVEKVGTVEGYFATKVAHNIAKDLNIEMPIASQCYKICYEDLLPQDAINQLMKRPKKHENEAATWLTIK